MKKQKTWVEVSQSSLQENIRNLRGRLAPGILLMAVVKSNAYGHGLGIVGPEAISAGADWLGVDSIDEAVSLRRAGIDAPILVLGYTMNERLEDAIRHKIRLTVYNIEQARIISKLAEEAQSYGYIHLKLETGTSRQGLAEDEALEFVHEVRELPFIRLEGLSTHFANIEDTTDHSYATEQRERFLNIRQKIVEEFGSVPISHTACSAALVLFPETHFDMVRAGISMYGHWSSPQTHASGKEKGIDMELKPVLTWKTSVAQVKQLAKGTSVSYGLTERVGRDSTVAVLPVGYWDGVDRKLSSIGEVLIRGERAKILGRVCMNMTVVDVTDIPGVVAEDEVVLIGRQGEEVITAEDLAGKIGTINYEVVTRVNPVIQRVLVD